MSMSKDLTMERNLLNEAEKFIFGKCSCGNVFMVYGKDEPGCFDECLTIKCPKCNEKIDIGRLDIVFNTLWDSEGDGDKIDKIGSSELGYD